MKKILFADDDKNLREYVSTYIPEDKKSFIDIADTASAAINMVKNNKYDKVVLDIRFNGETLTGLDVLKEAVEQKVPERIIFTSVSNRMDLYALGATAAFRKPLSIKKIAKFLIEDNYELLEEGSFF